MLILTRKIGQRIFIGGRTIKVIVLDIKGGQVKLGIDAPPTMAVHREEIQERIDDEQRPKGSSGLSLAARFLSRRQRP